MARYDNIEELESGLDGAGLSIGIVMSRFNIDIGEGLLCGCTEALTKHGVREQDMLIVTVPGALESTHSAVATCVGANLKGQHLTLYDFIP